MRIIGLLVVVLTISTDCSHQQVVTKDSNSAESNAERSQVAATPMNAPGKVATNNEQKKEIPEEFRSSDFKNFYYPTKLRGEILLKDGERIFENPEGGGDTFSFREVAYADLTADGKKEAIVHLSVVSCGASCDGGSDLFYFYSAGRNKPGLLSRLETGSTAYGECGLKSFALSKSNLTIELFQICQSSGISFKSLSDPKNQGGKFEAQSFTRFRYLFHKNRFVVKDREVFPFPPGDVRTHDRTISFSNE